MKKLIEALRRIAEGQKPVRHKAMDEFNDLMVTKPQLPNRLTATHQIKSSGAKGDE